MLFIYLFIHYLLFFSACRYRFSCLRELSERAPAGYLLFQLMLTFFLFYHFFLHIQHRLPYILFVMNKVTFQSGRVMSPNRRLTLQGILLLRNRKKYI